MSMTLGDHDVIVAFRSGDDAAFDAVVVEHRAELLRHAARSAPDAATAEDLVQETFVLAYRAFSRLPDDSRIRPWLHQILRNVCIDDSHRRRREHDKTERAFNETPLGSFGDGPEEILGLDHDASDALVAALTDLPATHRDAFVQRVVVGLEYGEIAAREGVSEPNARARVSRARSALRRALQGAAAVPIACYLVIRRPGRSALASPSDPTGASAATAVASSPTTVDHASRIATSLAPAVEAATSVATGAAHSMPLLTKAAVGIGAVATVTLAAAPERPIEVPPAVTVEVTADELDAPIVIAAEPAPTSPVAVAPTTAAATTIPATTTSTAELLASEVPVVTVAVSTDDAPADPDPTADRAPVAADTTVAPTTLPATTVPPTTVAPTTVPPTTVPPLVGGSLQATVSITTAGPRLDLAGAASITVTGTSSGSLSGRIGVGDPDPAGQRRVDGLLTVILPGGTIELRLAGHATSEETTNAGVPPTSLTMSGVYRASGATGQLVTSGSFSASLAGGTLALSLAP